MEARPEDHPNIVKLLEAINSTPDPQKTFTALKNAAMAAMAATQPRSHAAGK